MPACILVGRPARAEDDIAAARKDFAEGVRLFQEGDFEGARASFRSAEAEHHAAVTLYNIARAEERLGHPQLAVDAYRGYLNEAGEGAELSAAAALAVEQIKGRSARVRVETRPSGARVFLDGAALAEATPVTLLVPIGRHHIVVEGEGWRDETDIDGLAPVRVTTVILAKPAVAPALPPTPPAPAPPSKPDELIYGLQFALVPYRFFAGGGATTATFGLAAGGVFDLGYALTERVEIMAHGMGAIGSEGTPFTSIYSAGGAVSVRVLPSVWLGAGFLGGRADTNAGKVKFGTDWVFSPMAEASLALLTTRSGQWMVSLTPSILVASPGDNTALFVPVSFGFRSF